MSDEPKKPPAGYEVGYGKPPAHSQFRKGQSGNPRGRSKQSGPVTINLAELTSQMVTVTQNGVSRVMSAKEVQLLSILKRALEGDLKATTFLLEQFEKHQAIEVEEVRSSAVVHLPSDIPDRMTHEMLERHGLPPWTKAQTEAAWRWHIATRDEEEKRFDLEIFGR